MWEPSTSKQLEHMLSTHRATGATGGRGMEDTVQLESKGRLLQSLPEIRLSDTTREVSSAGEISMDECEYEWHVEGDGGLIQYSTSAAASLESTYRQRLSQCHVRAGRHSYEVTFEYNPDGTLANVWQVNVAYRFNTRKVKRTKKASLVPLHQLPPGPLPIGAEAWRGRCHELSLVLLSSTCRLTLETEPSLVEVPDIMSDSELHKLLQHNVPRLNQFKFRGGPRCVVDFIVQTYNKGLRMVQGNAALVEHSKHAIRYIIWRCSQLPVAERKTHLKALCEAFTSCQAEQARVIDSIYGELSGRDKGLREQILAMLDRAKQRTLDEVTLHFHPGSDRSARMPHIQSRYRVELGLVLGLSGIETAKMDQHIEGPISSARLASFEALFRERFSVSDFVKEVVADVNQQEKDVERFIIPSTLFKWAQPENLKENHGFDSYSIFYDEDQPDKYDGKPKQENMFTQAFVNPMVVVNILIALFAPKA